MLSRRQMQELEESKGDPQEKRERNPQSLSPESRQPWEHQEQIDPNAYFHAPQNKTEGPLKDSLVKLQDVEEKLRKNFGDQRHELEIITQNLQKAFAQSNFALSQLGEFDDVKFPSHYQKSIDRMTAAQREIMEAVSGKIRDITLANEKQLKMQAQQPKNDQKKKKKQKNKKKAKDQDADEYLNKILEEEQLKSEKEIQQLDAWLATQSPIPYSRDHNHDVDTVGKIKSGLIN